jgi:uncharacterized protein
MSDAGFPPVQPYGQQPTIPIPVTSEERNLGMLAHVLMIFTGFIGPLIIFFVKRDSKFVRYHSVMALFWQLVVMAFWMVMMVVFFATMFGTFINMPAQGKNAPPPPQLFLVFGVVWGGAMLIWVLNIILGVVYGIKAHKGEWGGYPVIKKWAAKVAGA